MDGYSMYKKFEEWTVQKLSYYRKEQHILNRDFSRWTMSIQILGHSMNET